MSSVFRTLIVGHLPPPVTGENLCRQRLKDTLEAAGVTVIDVARAEVGSLCGRCDLVVIVCGQSFIGTIYDIAVTWWSLLFRRRVWWYFHNASWLRFRKVPKWLWLGRKDSIRAIVLRDQIAVELKDSGYDVAILNNCIEAEFEGRDDVACCGATLRLIWMGRADVEKGFFIAVEVYRKLKASDANWRFDVYGITQDWAVKHGVGDLSCHGFISGRAKVDALRRGGVFILPSWYKNETQPLSIIEALSCGVPVVASATGGIPGMIIAAGGCGGIVVEELDVARYADAVREVVTRYNEYSRHAVRIYNELFSRSRFADSVRKLLALHMEK